MNEEYTVITPLGCFTVVFGEEGTPAEFVGEEGAIEFFRLFLLIKSPCNRGVLITMQNLTPDDLQDWCQPDGSGITVIQPLDDFS